MNLLTTILLLACYAVDAAGGIQVVVATNSPYLVGSDGAADCLLKVQWWPDEPDAEPIP